MKGSRKEKEKRETERKGRENKKEIGRTIGEKE